MNAKLQLVVADIVRRIPHMAIDSPVNNERLLTGLLEPLLSRRVHVFSPPPPSEDFMREQIRIEGIRHGK